MNLTKAEAIENHRKMWRWIAEETEKRKRKVEKRDYFKEMKIDDRLEDECYCCEYAASFRCIDMCKYCPIKWPNERCVAALGAGLFDRWRVAIDYQKAAELARQIAELPENKTHFNHLYSWDEIYCRAENGAFLSAELAAKDNARQALREIILDTKGIDIETCESPEEEIEIFLDKYKGKYKFDERGNMYTVYKVFGLDYFTPYGSVKMFNDLETILKRLGCKEPFDKTNNEITEEGMDTYNKLLDLLYRLANMGVIRDVGKIVDELDAIIDGNVY